MQDPFKPVAHIDIPFTEDLSELTWRLISVFRIDKALTFELGDLVAEPDDSELVNFKRRLLQILLAIRNDPRLECYKIEENIRGDDVSDLWRHLFDLALLWWTKLHRLPGGPFPEPEVGHRPMANTCADFLYGAIRGLGLSVSDLEFRRQFMMMMSEFKERVCDDHEED
jgi:hypothetical protein